MNLFSNIRPNAEKFQSVSNLSQRFFAYFAALLLISLLSISVSASISYHAGSETLTTGTSVSGTYLDTYTNNNVYRAIRERSTTPYRLDASYTISGLSGNDSYALDVYGYSATENFSVTADGTAVGNITQGTPATTFSDNFETDLEKWNENGTTAWDLQTDNYHSGLKSVKTDYYNEGYLTSDNIDLSDAHAATLDFEFYRTGFSTSGSSDVILQFWDGTTWDTIANLRSVFSYGSWNHYTTTIDMSQYKRSDFKIRFNAIINYTSEAAWVDDLVLNKTPDDHLTLNVTSQASDGSVIVRFQDTVTSDYSNRDYLYIDQIEIVGTDSTPPSVGSTTVSGYATYTGTANYINGSGTIVGGTATDSGSGIDTLTCQFATIGADWAIGTWNTNHCEGTGPAITHGSTYYFNTRVKDLAGNQGTGTSVSYTGDTVAPVVDTISITPLYNNSITNFVLGTSNISASITEGGSGVNSCEYTLNGSTWTAATYNAGPQTCTATGVNTAGASSINVRATDKVGNVGTGGAVAVTPDTAGPTGESITITDTGGYTTDNTPDLTLFATDVGSGMKEMAFSCNGSTWSSWTSYATSYSLFNIETGAGCSAGNGSKTVYVKYRDNLNQESSSTSDTTYLDTTAPVVSGLTITPMHIAGGTNYISGTSTISATVSESGSGVLSCEYTLNGTDWVGGVTYTPGSPGTCSITGIDTSLATSINMRATDNLANQGTGTAVAVSPDTAGPTGESIEISDTDGYTNDNAPDLTLSATDSGSGMKEMAFSCDGSTWSSWIAYATSYSSFNIETGAGCTIGDGSKTVFVKYRDNLDNESASTSDTTFLDKVDPESDSDFDGTAGVSPWFISEVEVTLSATDAAPSSGVKEIRYRLDGGDWAVYVLPFTVSKEGTTSLYYYSVDMAGNSETANVLPIKIDTSNPDAPVLADLGEWNTTGTFNLNWPIVNDTVSGTGYYKIYRDGTYYDSTGSPNNWFVENSVSDTTQYNYRVSTVDVSGRESALSNEESIKIDRTAPTAGVLQSLLPWYNTTTLDLAWTAATDNWRSNINRYEAWKGLSAGGEALFANVGLALAHTDPGALENEVTYYYKINSVDNAELNTFSNEESTTIDLIDPVTKFEITGGILGENGWYKTDAVFELSATDNISSVNKIEYNTGSGWITRPGAITSDTLSSEGITTVTYRATDNATNTESEQSNEVKIDKTAPTGQTIFLGSDPAYSKTGQVTADLEIGSDASPGSGLWYCEVDWKDGSPVENVGLSDSATHTYTTDGSKTAEYTCYDQAGQPSEIPDSDDIFVDTVQPVSGYTLASTEPKSSSGWYVSDVTVTIPTVDSDPSSGIKEIDYSVDGGTPVVVEPSSPSNTFSTSTVLSTDGLHSVKFLAKDNAGNEESEQTTETIKIDQTDPVSSVQDFPSEYTASLSFTVNWAGTDATSGIATYDVFYSEDDKAYVLWKDDTTDTSATFTGKDGNKYEFYSIATDVAGNKESKAEEAEATTTIDVTAPRSSLLKPWDAEEIVSPFEFLGTATDATSGIKSIELDIKPAAKAITTYTEVYGFISGDKTANWYRTLVLNDNVETEVRVRVTDVAGNMTQTDWVYNGDWIPFRVNPDPTIGVVSALYKTTPTTETMHIFGKVPLSATRVDLNVWSEDGAIVWSQANLTLTGRDYEKDIDLAGWAYKTYYVEATFYNCNHVGGACAKINNAYDEFDAYLVKYLQGQIAMRDAQITGLQEDVLELQTHLNTLEIKVLADGNTIVQNTADIADLQARMVIAEGAITTIQGQITALQAKDANLQAQIDALAGRASALEAGLAGLNTRMGNLELWKAGIDTWRTGVDSWIVSTTTTLGNLAAADTGLAGQITTINGTLTSLQNQINSNDANIATIFGTLGTIATQISGLHTTDTDLQSQINNIVNTQIPGLKSQISDLNARLIIAEGKVSALETHTATLQTDLNSLESRVLVTEADINALKTKMNAAEADIDTLQGLVSGLQTENGTQQTQINNLLSRMHTVEDTNIPALKTQINDLRALILKMNHGTINLSFNSDTNTLRIWGEAPEGTNNIFIRMTGKAMTVTIEGSLGPDENNQYDIDTELTNTTNWYPERYSVVAEFYLGDGPPIETVPFAKAGAIFDDLYILWLNGRIKAIENTTIPKIQADIAALKVTDAQLDANIAALKVELLLVESELTGIINNLHAEMHSEDAILQAQIDNIKNVLIPGLQSQIDALSAKLGRMNHGTINLYYSAAGKTLKVWGEMPEGTATVNIKAFDTSDVKRYEYTATVNTTDNTYTTTIDISLWAKIQYNIKAEFLDGNALLTSEASAIFESLFTNDLQVQLSALNAEVDSVETDVSHLQTDLNALTTRVSTAEGKINQNILDIADLNGRMISAEGKITTIQWQITALQAMDANQQAQIDALAGRATALEAGLAGLTIRVSDLEIWAAGIEIWKADTNTWIANTNITLANLAAQDINLQGQIVVINGTLTSLQSQIYSNDADINTINTTLGIIASQISALQSKDANLQAQIDIINSTLTSLQNQINALNTRLTTVEGKVATLETKVSTLQTDLDALETRVLHNETDINTIYSNIAALQGRMATAEGEIDALQTEVTNLHATDANLQAQIDALKARVSSLEGRMTSIEGRVTTLEAWQAGIETWKADTNIWIANTNTTLSNLAAQDTNLQVQIVGINGTLADLQGQINSNDFDIATINGTLTTIAGQISALQAKDANLQAQIDNIVTVQIPNLQTQINTLDSRLDIIEPKVATLETKVFGLQTDLNALTTRVTTAEGKIAQNISDIASLQARMLQAETDINALKTEVTNLHATDANHQAQIDALKARVSGLEGRMTDVEDRVTALETWKAEMVIWQTNTNTWIATTNTTLANLAAQDTNLQVQIVTINGTLGSLQNQIYSNDADINTINTTLGTIASQISALQAKDANLQAQIVIINGTLADLQAQLNALKDLVGRMNHGTINLYYSDAADTLKVWGEMPEGTATVNIKAFDINGTIRYNGTAAINTADNTYETTIGISGWAAIKYNIKAEFLDGSTIISEAGALFDNLYIVWIEGRVAEIENTDLPAINAQISALWDANALQSAQINALKEKVQDLNIELTAMINDLNADTYARDANLQAQIDALKARATSLEGRMTSAEGRLDALEAWKAAMELWKADINSWAITVNTTLANLAAKDANLQAQIGVINGTLASLQAQISSNDADIAAINTTLGLIATQISALQTKDANLQAQIDNIVHVQIPNLQSQIDILDSRISVLKTRMDAAESDIDTLQADMDALETRVLHNETDINTIYSQITTLQGRMTTAENDIIALEGEVAGLHSTDANLQAQIDALKARATALEDRMTSLEGRVTALEAWKATMETWKTGVNSWIAATDTTLANLATKDANLQAQIVIINGTLADLQAQITSNDFDINTINTTLGIIASQISALQSKDANLQAQIDNIVGVQIPALLAQIGAIDARLIIVEGKVATLETKVATLQTDLAALAGRVTITESDINALKARMTTAENDIIALEGEVAGLHAMDANHQAQIDALKARVSSLESRMTSAEGRLDALETWKAAIDIWKTGVNAWIATTNTTLANLAAQDVNLQVQIVGINGTLASLQSQIYSNDADINTINNTLEIIASEISALHTTDANLQAQINNIVNVQIPNLQSQINALDTRLTTAEGKVTILETKVFELQTDLNALEIRVLQNETDIGIIYSEIAILQGRMDTAEDDIIALEGEVTSLHTMDANLQAQIDALKGRVSDLELRMTAVEGRVTALEAWQAGMEIWKADVNNWIANTNTTLANLAAQDTNLQNQIVVINGTLASLQSQITSNDADINTINHTLANIAIEIMAMHVADIGLQSQINMIATVQIPALQAQLNALQDLVGRMNHGTINMSHNTSTQKLRVWGEVPEGTTTVRIRVLDTGNNLLYTYTVAPDVTDNTYDKTIDISGWTAIKYNVRVRFLDGSDTIISETGALFEGLYIIWVDGRVAEIETVDLPAINAQISALWDANALQSAQINALKEKVQDLNIELRAIISDLNADTYARDADLQAQIDALKDRATSLETRMGSAEGRLDALEIWQAAIDDWKADINSWAITVNTTLTNLAAQDVNLQNQIVVINGTLANLQAQISSNDADIAAINTTLGIIASQISALQTKDANLQAQIDNIVLVQIPNLQSQIDILDSRIDVLDTRMTAAESDIDTLQADMDALETRVLHNETDINTIYSNIATLQGRMTAAETEITELWAEAAGLHSTDANLQAQIDALKARATSLESRMASLEGRVTALEAWKATMETWKTGVNSWIANTDITLANLAAKDANLQGQIVVINGTLANLQSQITSNDADIAAINTTLGVIASQISALQAKDANLQAQINNIVGVQIPALQAQLDALKDLVGRMNHGTINLYYSNAAGTLRVWGEAPEGAGYAVVKVYNMQDIQLPIAPAIVVPNTANEYQAVLDVSAWDSAKYNIVVEFYKIAGGEFLGKAGALFDKDFNYGFWDIDSQGHVSTYYVQQTTIPVTYTVATAEGGFHDIYANVNGTDQKINASQTLDAHKGNTITGWFTLSAPGDYNVFLWTVDQIKGTRYQSNAFTIRYEDFVAQLPASSITVVGPAANSEGIYWTKDDFELTAFLQGINWTKFCDLKWSFQGNSKLWYDFPYELEHDDNGGACEGTIFLDNMSNGKQGVYRLRVLNWFAQQQKYADILIGIDHKKPKVGIVHPGEHDILHGPVNTIQISVSEDSNAIKEVWITIYDKITGEIKWNKQAAFNSTTGYYEALLNSHDLPDKAYDLDANAMDIAGNTDGVRIDPLVDNTAPVIQSWAASSLNIVRGEKINFTANVTDNLSGISEVMATITEKASAKQYSVILSLSDGNAWNGTYRGIIDSNNDFATGKYDIEITATDAGTNAAIAAGDLNMKYGFEQGSIIVAPETATANCYAYNDANKYYACTLNETPGKVQNVLVFLPDMTITMSLNIDGNREIIVFPESHLVVSPQNAEVTSASWNAATQALRIDANGTGSQEIAVFVNGNGQPSTIIVDGIAISSWGYNATAKVVKFTMNFGSIHGFLLSWYVQPEETPEPTVPGGSHGGGGGGGGGGTSCGDNKCNGKENYCSCPKDCSAPKCGECEQVACDKNVPACAAAKTCSGNGVCEEGENCENAPLDCKCKEKTEECVGGQCFTVPYCGDSFCSDKEDCSACAEDCGCLNTETCTAGKCIAKPYCGDKTCQENESTESCPQDCAAQATPTVQPTGATPAMPGQTGLFGLGLLGDIAAGLLVVIIIAAGALYMRARGK